MSRAPYHITSIIAAWALASYSVALAALAAPPQLPFREFIWWIFPILYAAFALAACLLTDLLEDFQRQLDLREKFALFLAHVFLILAHIPLLRGFWIVWGMAVVMLPLLLFLQREINFNRLALACGVLWLARLVRHPGDSPGWTLGFAALVLLMLITSRYFTTYRRYGVERGEAAFWFWRIAGLWIAGVTAFGGLAWLVLPRLTPVEFSPTSSAAGTPPFGAGARSPIDSQFIFETLLWASAVFGILYVIYYIRSKIRGGGKIPFAVARSTLQRVKEELDRKVVQPWRANLMNPADRVIFYYNMFCDAMSRFDLPRRPSMTPGEYRRHLLDRSPIGRGRRDDLDFLTEQFQKALYGAGDITSVDSRHFQRLAHDIIDSHEKTLAPPRSADDASSSS